MFLRGTQGFVEKNKILLFMKIGVKTVLKTYFFDQKLMFFVCVVLVNSVFTFLKNMELHCCAASKTVK